MKTKKSFRVGIALALVLALVGCTTSQVTTDINIVAEGAAAVVTALSVAGVVSPAVAAQITNYARQASQLVIDVNKELANSADSKIQQWTVISGYFAAIVVPNIPGVPTSVATTIAILDAALVALEGALASQLGSTPTMTAKVHNAGIALPAPVGKSMTDAVNTANRTLNRVGRR